jgi:hypothetical protein
MGCADRQRRRPAGFSLGEMLAVVIIGSMILVAILGIYTQVNRAADGVLRKIDSPSWTREVLQLIARDLDRTVSGDDVTVQIRNGYDNKFQRAELVLRRTYHDSENKELVLEEITWRAGYDPEGASLAIYRSHEGVAPEDRLLDENREDVEKSFPFVPICRGVTFFKIQACQGGKLLDQWPMTAPPSGIKMTLSFGEPHEVVRGGYDVADSEKICRTVALDPTRKIQFAAAAALDANGVPDANAPVSDASERTAEKDRSSDKQSQKGPSPRQPAAPGRTTDGQTSTRTRSR